MASGNAEIIRAGLEAFNSGGVNALMPFVHPDFEATTPPGLAAEPDTYRGHDGVRRYFDSFYEAMDEIRFEADEFIEVGDQVVVTMTLRARGRTTGIEAAQSLAQVWELKDGKALRIEVFATLDEAMAAARGGSSGAEAAETHP